MRTILCIDDHQATLVTLSLIFRGAGYCCITATNFEQAERAFAADPIDLVVLDHGLPGVNGTSIATHLKKIREVAVLMLTGSSELMTKPDSVDVLLPKPQPPPALLEAVAKLLDSRDKT
jgi:two-component system, OmpR family, KDP operon response regulator KdpE